MNLARNAGLIASLAALLSCGDDPMGGEGNAPARIEVTPAVLLLEAIGEAVPLQARVIGQDGRVLTDAAVTWVSSDPAVATVDKAGLVQATGDGRVEVTAMFAHLAAAASIAVRQRVAGFEFEHGPRDAVVGGSSGDVTLIARDPRGSPVAAAAGPVTLAILAGSPGGLVDGPRTAAMAEGRARFADVRVTGGGDGYRLEATWREYAITSLPFSVVPGFDVVILQHAPAAGAGLLVDGFGSGGFLNDVAVRAAGTTIDVGVFRSVPGGNDEILAFGAGRRPAMLRPVPWTAGIDTVIIGMEDVIALDVTVWIVKGPIAAQAARARAALDTTLSIWGAQNAGLAFDTVEVVDATGAADASLFYDLTLCNSQSGLESRIGKRTGRINVYYVGTVDGGTDRGRACPIGGDHVTMAERSGHELLSHEIGHLLSLTHTDAITGAFDQANVMHSASSRRRYLTEGQTFRQQFDTNSVLNRLFRLRSDQARSCPLSAVTALCPAIETRLWPDGSFPAGSGPGRVAALAQDRPAEWLSAGDVVHRWLSIQCEMDGNEGLGERLRALGDVGTDILVAAFREGPSDPDENVDRWRLAVIDGLAWLGTDSAFRALEAIAAGTRGALRAEVLRRSRRAGAPSA